MLFNQKWGSSLTSPSIILAAISDRKWINFVSNLNTNDIAMSCVTQNFGGSHLAMSTKHKKRATRTFALDIQAITDEIMMLNFNQKILLL